MSSKNSTFERKFFMNSDPAFCLVPHPNRCTHQALPEFLLQDHQFTELGWHERQQIYLPATTKFPQASYILEEALFPEWKHARGVKRTRLSLAGERKVRSSHGGQKRVESFSHEIDEFMREFLLEQARARVGRKFLPSFKVVTATFHGTSICPCTIICESVTGEESMNGSYVTFQIWQNSPGQSKQDNKEILNQCFRRIFGFDARGFDSSTYEDMLARAYPEFPWSVQPPKRPTA